VVVTNDLSSLETSIPYLDVVLAKAPSSATKRIVRHLPKKKKNICEAIPVLVKLEGRLITSAGYTAARLVLSTSPSAIGEPGASWLGGQVVVCAIKL